MNFAHLHLLLNHFPIIGTIVGLGLFLISLVGKKNEDLRRAGLIIFTAMALISILAFFSGVGADGAIRKTPGISEDLIVRHQGAAMLALFFMEITGALSLVALWKSQERLHPTHWNWSLSGVLFFSLITVGLMARVGTTGGDIRHPEIGTGQEQADTSGISKMVHAFEPSPDKFAELMTASKWWWAFMMDLHFVGLAILIGTVGFLNLRVLGFAKQIPVAPLHQLVPWAMVGFGFNLVTGVLAFTGMAAYYTYDWAFWLKMLAIMLLGLNVAAFYLTGAFESVADLGPGENAPPLAKFLAGTSLVLWFLVITLGRYIQSYSDTISVHK
ncbi:MAG TPA: hypothetical protein VK709_00760 [Candidatus Saccharimonadales bacterium]|jgi:hypothetical protein|nr:hypothetical protein [Candidatus Saccharimonadales bacterium]